MDWQTGTSCLFIFVSALIVLSSFVRFRLILRMIPYLPKLSRPELLRFFNHQRLLMLLFFVGFILVGISFLLDMKLIGELFVAAIFLLCAVFIYSGVDLLSNLQMEFQSRIHDLLPICSHCKKIRIQNSDPHDQNSWIELESYIADNTDTRLTHGLCPECVCELYPEYIEKKNRQRADSPSPS